MRKAFAVAGGVAVVALAAWTSELVFNTRCQCGGKIVDSPVAGATKRDAMGVIYIVERRCERCGREYEREIRHD